MEDYENYSKLYKNFLIETSELINLLQDPKTFQKLRILDCTLYLPVHGKDAKECFQKERIPYSQFFDIDEIADKTTSLPHMIPTESFFINEMQKMDIRKSDLIICYDRHGMFSAPRAWFTFKIFSHENVKVLNGGIIKYIEEGYPLEFLNDYRIADQNKLRSEAMPDDFAYKKDEKKIVNLKEVMEISIRGRQEFVIIDARPAPRFFGEAPEPRPCLRLGCIDGSINIPFKNMVDEKSCFKIPEELIKEFNSKEDVLKKNLWLVVDLGQLLVLLF